MRLDVLDVLNLPDVGRDWRGTGDLGGLTFFAGDPPPLRFKPAGAMVCHRCGVEDRPQVSLCPPGSVHYASASCRHCGSWLRWLPRPRTEAEQAERRDKAMTYAPPSQAQLALLKTLGDTDVPGSMKQASARIEALLAQRHTGKVETKRWGIDRDR
jgi:hypothetical protein